MKPGISVAIISENEEKFIQKCLDSVYNLADEIVLMMDCHATDKTREIAEKCNKVIVYKHDYSGDLNFSEMRNKSLRKCSHRWTVVIDADETMATDQHRMRTEILMNGDRDVVLMAQCDQVSGDKVYSTLTQPRVFPTRKGIMYEGAQHNIPRIPETIPTVPSNLTFKHHGFADPDKRAKRIARTEKLVQRVLEKINEGGATIKDFYDSIKMLQVIGDPKRAVEIGLKGMPTFNALPNRDKTNSHRYLLTLAKAMMLTNDWDRVGDILDLHMHVAGEYVDSMFLQFVHSYRKGCLVSAYIYGLKYLELYGIEARNNLASVQIYTMYEPVVREKLNFISYALKGKYTL